MLYRASSYFFFFQLTGYNLILLILIIFFIIFAIQIVIYAFKIELDNNNRLSYYEIFEKCNF